MLFIQQALRSASQSKPLQTVSILDIQKETGFTGVRLSAKHNVTGKRYVHFVTPSGEYLSVGLGSSAVVTATKDADIIKELVNDHIIYTGDEDNNGNKINRWFTFGKTPADLQPTVVIPFAELMANGVTNKAMAQLLGAKP